jgi:hypothetical protein
VLVVGLDHSLTAFGLTAVRPDWELDFHRVRRVTLKTGPDYGPDAARRHDLARDAAEWIRRVAVSFDEPLTSVRAFIESGIFNPKMVDTIRSQERLAGAVESALWAICIRLELAQQRSVRSVFMGKSASGGRGAGEAAQELLKAACPVTRTWDEAELDAFLVTNWALAEAGEAFVSVAPPVELGRTA